MERRDQIVMLFSIFIVEQRFPADTLRQDLVCDQHPFRTDLCICNHHFQGVQGGSCVPVCKCGNLLDLPVCDLHVLSGKPGRMCKRLADQFCQIFYFQSLLGQTPGTWTEALR